MKVSLMEATLVSGPDISLQNASYLSSGLNLQQRPPQVICQDVHVDPQCRVCQI